MEVLVNIIIRFLSQLVGRWLSFTLLKQIIIDFIAANKTKFLLFIGVLIKEILEWIADNVGLDDIKHPKDAVLRFLLERTGLQLEGFDKESMKKAAGQLIADKINEKYGTNFAGFYPIENIVDDIKAQLLAEILAAVE